MKTVYLAGPISGKRYTEANDWRRFAAHELAAHGIQAVNPLRGKDFLANIGPLEKQYLGVHPLATNSGITTRDRFDVQRCDLMLAHFPVDISDRVSIGTAIEFGWADAYRTPVICSMEEGNIHEHAMTSELTGWRVYTLQDAIDLAVSIIGADQG